MKDDSAFEHDLASIHKLMERSVKFISLSGMSGILSGVYALAGAGAAYYLIQYPGFFFEYRLSGVPDLTTLMELFSIAWLVLLASIITGLILSARKAKRMGAKVWDATSKRLVVNLSIPLITGGVFVLITVWNGQYEIIAAAFLIFYGLALVNASPNLFDELRYLGYSEIVLGLIAAAVPEYGLVFWSIGFGVLHIIYGAVMYRKYDR